MGPDPTITLLTLDSFLMAKHLDLEEQEQIDQLKHFWNTYGNLITWTLILVFGAIAAWNGFQFWQRSQAAQSAALYEEIEKAARGNDVARLERAFADIKDRFGRTSYAQQAALLASKTLSESGKVDGAEAALNWLGENGSDPAYRTIARLRLASLLVERKSFDAALKLLSDDAPKEFAALVADRKGDIHLLSGRKPEALSEYRRSVELLENESDYRRIVEVKLAAVGGAPVSQGTSKPAGSS